MDTLSQWWTKQQWPEIDPAFLPDTGFIVSSLGHGPLAAGFVYKTNSKLWFFEWIVGDPDAPKQERSEALNQLINYVIKWSKSQGASALMTMTQHKGLISRLGDAGFAVTDEAMTHVVRRL